MKLFFFLKASATEISCMRSLIGVRKNRSKLFEIRKSNYTISLQARPNATSPWLPRVTSKNLESVRVSNLESKLSIAIGYSIDLVNFRGRPLHVCVWW